MKHILVELMSHLTPLTSEEVQAIEENFPIKTFNKGTFLLREGQVAKVSYYVLKGCIREYELLEGEEKTMAFYTEDQTVANFKSLTNNLPSDQNYICSESTTVTVLSAEKEQQLYLRHPRFESFCRVGLEQMMGEQQEHFVNSMVLTPQERYAKLLKERPDMINRVPQYQLASYLGIKPETLSRIKRRITTGAPSDTRN